MKAAALLRVLLTRPGEFRDRILTIVESLADSLNRPGSMAATDMAAMVRATGEVVGADLGNFFQEEGLQEIEARIQSARTKLLNGAARVHDATTELARMCYALCRAVGPEVVVETGVGNGVTSSYFLQALKVNSKGSLWSLDLLPLAAQSGLLVPLPPVPLREKIHNDELPGATADAAFAPFCFLGVLSKWQFAKTNCILIRLCTLLCSSGDAWGYPLGISGDQVVMNGDEGGRG